MEINWSFEADLALTLQYLVLYLDGDCHIKATVKSLDVSSEAFLV